MAIHFSPLQRRKFIPVAIAGALLLTLPIFLIAASVQQDLRTQAAKKELGCVSLPKAKWQTNQTQPDSKQTIDKLNKAHTSLTSQVNEYRRGKGKDEKNKKKLRDTANIRKQYFAQLVRENPQAALAFITKNKSAEKSILDVTSGCAAAPTDVEGTLTVSHADYQSRSRDFYTLISGNKKYALHPSGKAKKALLSQMRVKVSGYVLDNELLLDTKNPESIVGGLSASAVDHAQGEQKTAVLIADSSLAKDMVDSHVFTTISDYYEKTSYGKISLTGETYGPYSVADQGCDTNGIPVNTQAILNAADADVDFGAIKRIIIFGKFSCGWGGYGLSGLVENYLTKEGNGPFSVAWLSTTGNNEPFSGIVAHELGHNFGVDHAVSLACGGPGICDKVNEYGNPYSVMGAFRNLGQMGAPHRDFIGWFDEENIQTINESGTYTIEPIEQSGSGLKALKIPRGSEDYLYIEYRQPIDSDENFEDVTGTNVFEGALLQILEGGNPKRPAIFDPTEPAAASGVSMQTAALPPGETFTDPATGTTIAVTDASSDELTVDIEYKGPEVSVAPRKPSEETNDEEPTPDPCELTPSPSQDGQCEIHDPTGKTKEGYSWSNVNRWNDLILKAINEVSQFSSGQVSLKGIRVPADRIKAHMMIESQGIAEAHQKNPIGDAYGLMQVTENAASYNLLTASQKSKLKSFDPYTGIYAGTLELAYRYQSAGGQKNWDRASAGYFGGDPDGNGICDPVTGYCPDKYRALLDGYLAVLADSECAFEDQEETETPDPTDIPDIEEPSEETKNPDGTTPKDRTRTKNPEREQRKLAREIRKKTGNIPSITVNVPKPNVKKPVVTVVVPTPKKPTFSFPDWFSGNRNRQKDLGDEIRSKMPTPRPPKKVVVTVKPKKPAITVTVRKPSIPDIRKNVKDKLNRTRIQAEPCDTSEELSPTPEGQAAKNKKKKTKRQTRILSILDYNTLIACYSDTLPARKCSSDEHELADLNNDGKVDRLDYNQFLEDAKN